MKSTRFIFGRTLLVLCAVLFVSLGFISCKQDSEDDYGKYDLQGTWVGEYESYTIDVEKGTFDAGSYSYAGKDMEIKFTGSDSGYIYIKYTRAYETSETELTTDVDTWQKAVCNDGKISWLRYSSTAPDVGKWYAISFKDLTAKSISLSGAWGDKSSTDSLEEAIKEFTIANGYFAYYSELVKK